MATIVIRNLDEKVKRKLQVRAALNRRSMEAEARATLAEGLDESLSGPRAVRRRRGDVGLAAAIHELFAPLGGADDIPFPQRTFSHRPIPKFDE